ncbi:DNA ligase D [Flavihumibacter sp. UBA7668]|uniref:DNA ligase D n=1 Tax=Flavihumibacter sp. UBA7668 TaxID=1946542 RepID=UPI0025BC9A09|nr:DNA ligase D [Flavihumibacter sp. UBA7668]
MSLSLYKQKRTFDKTPEPQSGKSRNSKLIFVIQKHKASRLHYDLRLEMEGVLKSWAVPKEPSMNPRDKRLAIMVEDHPYDYKDFEGTIPKGNYGAGEVKIWDTGTYTPIDGSKGKPAQEKSLLKQLKEGSLKFSLQGKKLKGEFALVKTKGMGENAWLLIKHKDKAASVETSYTFPKKLSPMLATLVDEPFDDEAWEFEIKWDGYRALAFRKGRTAQLLSRNGKSFAEKFYPVVEALKAWKEDLVVDGEIVVVDEKGVARFDKLQNWRSEADGQLLFYVFDILWHKGKDLMDLPLSERMKVLKSIIPPDNETIKIGFSVTGRGKDFFASVQKMGLEGIIAKRLSSTYRMGERSKDWLKIKAQKRQEVIIVGFTRKEGSPKLFSSLLLGVYNNGKLFYAGKVGTGFTDSMQKEMMVQFKPLIVKRSPLQEIPDYNKATRFRPDPPPAKATWLKPELVGEISFTEITEQGVFRHPSFKGMREDKPAKKVIQEKEQQPALLNASEKTQVIKINRHELKFTNLDKLFWKEEKITKRDLLNYYHQVAPYILPYIKDRPQSLYRFPDGYKGKSFYQKDVTGKVPDWAATYAYHAEGDKTDKHFLVAKDEASLLYMVNFGCIEINPWSSTVKKPDHPDWCLLDLDPGEKTSFNKVIDAANLLHDLLNEIDVPSFPKTSGSTGIHIYIPLGKKYTYEQSKEFARVLVTMVQRDAIRYTTIERTVNARNGKLYLDFLQNRPQATLAAPYSVRPKPGATVSMPLHWEELKQGLKMKDFTLKNVPALLEERGDLFRPVLGKGIDMKAALKRLQQL